MPQVGDWESDYVSDENLKLQALSWCSKEDMSSIRSVTSTMTNVTENSNEASIE